MFGFLKKKNLMGSSFLPSLLSTTPLSCISMNNQACKVRAEIINVKRLYFILLALKQVNLVATLTVLMIHCKNMCS